MNAQTYCGDAYRFYCDCVGWPRDDVNTPGGLHDLIQDRREISRRAFLARVDREELAEMEQAMSYAKHPRQGLTMAGDFHVEYFRSKLHGKRVYGFRHSGIEHVFVRS